MNRWRPACPARRKMTADFGPGRADGNTATKNRGLRSARTVGEGSVLIRLIRDNWGGTGTLPVCHPVWLAREVEWLRWIQGA